MKNNEIHKTEKSKIHTASQQLYPKDIPGFVSVEAPSSRLDAPGIFASNSYKSNQILCLCKK